MEAVVEGVGVVDLGSEGEGTWEEEEEEQGDGDVSELMGWLMERWLSGGWRGVVGGFGGGRMRGCLGGL